MRSSKKKKTKKKRFTRKMTPLTTAESSEVLEPGAAVLQTVPVGGRAHAQPVAVGGQAPVGRHLRQLSVA